MFQSIIVKKINTRADAALIQAGRRKDMPVYGTVLMYLHRDTWVEDTDVNDGNTSFREFKLRICNKRNLKTLIGNNKSHNTRRLNPLCSCIFFINNGFCEM
jgi:hypothetical protein